MYCLLNRNYVTPPMLDLVSALADDVNQKFPGTTTVVLDGNFPFWDGFPLLPPAIQSATATFAPLIRRAAL
jgi:hypothetical protein